MKTVLRKTRILVVLSTLALAPAFAFADKGAPHAGRSTASDGAVEGNIQRPQVIHTQPSTTNEDGHAVIPQGRPPVERGPAIYSPEDEKQDMDAYYEDLTVFGREMDQALDGIQGRPQVTGEVPRQINSVIDYPVERSNPALEDAELDQF